MRRTLYNSGLVVAALPIAAIDSDTTTDGTTVDLAVFKNNFRDSVMFVVVTTAVTDGDFVFSIEESDNDSDYSPVPAARVQGTPPTLDSDSDAEFHSFGYIPGTARYVRLSVASTNTDAGGVMGAFAVLTGASSTPVARA